MALSCTFFPHLLTSSICLIFTTHLFLLSLPPTHSSISFTDAPPSTPVPQLVPFTEEEKLLLRRQAICFQQRHRTPEYEALCKRHWLDSFCENVHCQTPKTCPAGQTLVSNVLGHQCCPACVTFLPDGAPCTFGSLTSQCANGLFCDPSKGVCALPRIQEKCLIEYHNRMFFKAKAKVAAEDRSGFWIPAEKGGKVLKILYATDEMEIPTCRKSGQYETKQRLSNKAYCVHPKTGQPTFGVSDFGKAANTTCQCSSSMTDRLSEIDAHSSKRPTVQRELKLMNHFADVHIKCTPTGDYREMQCINETCLCVNEFTGVPLTTVDDWNLYKDKLDDYNAENRIGTDYIDPVSGKVVKDPKNRKMTDEELKEFEEKEDAKRAEELKRRAARVPTREVNSSAVAIFGAFKALVCFDFKRAKAVNSNFSKEVYIEDCQGQISTSMAMQKHFTAKGVSIRGIESVTCGHDDRFARKQCLPDSCRCSDPVGKSIGSYSVENSKGSEMDCRCALEEFFGKDEKQAFFVQNCDGLGNFKPLQCPDADSCFCADANGRPISGEFFLSTVQEFITNSAPGYSMALICSAMSGSVNNVNVYEERDELWYNPEMKWFTTNNTIPPASSVVSAHSDPIGIAQ